MRLQPSGSFAHSLKSIIRVRKHRRSMQVIAVAITRGLQTVPVVLCIIGIPMRRIELVRGRWRVSPIHQLPKRWEKSINSKSTLCEKMRNFVSLTCLSRSMLWNVIPINPHRLMQRARALAISLSPPTSAPRCWWITAKMDVLLTLTLSHLIRLDWWWWCRRTMLWICLFTCVRFVSVTSRKKC